MTSQVQPLKVSINKPFKHYDAWLNKDNHILTPGGKTKRASVSIIVEWILKAWEEMPVSIITK
jgi:phage host-nuclease inhibitor protein Gam